MEGLQVNMRIKVFKGAAIVVDENLEKRGVKFTTNTGDQVDEVKATGQNIKKYIKDKKYPEYKPTR